MDKKQLKEILAAHADQLVGSSEPEASDPNQTGATDDELTALLDVAEQVKSTLRPITPNLDFESELKRELLTTAHLRRAQGYVPPNPERDLLILAGVIGFLIGVLSIWIVFRLRR